MINAIGIVDYGMGNLHSVEKALQKAGASTRLVTHADEISSLDRLVVPGVGAFGDAMENLRRSGLDKAIQNFIATGKPFLGICLGMQILFEKSCEKGTHRGLGIISGEVKRFPDGNKIPQIGWNQICAKKDSPLFSGIPDASYFYLVHSYYTAPQKPENVLATTEYGIEYACAVQQGNAFGVQFHPEKSQQWGLKLLDNFVKN